VIINLKTLENVDYFLEIYRVLICSPSRQKENFGRLIEHQGFEVMKLLPGGKWCKLKALPSSKE
jgi:hypothetical protein